MVWGYYREDTSEEEGFRGRRQEERKGKERVVGGNEAKCGLLAPGAALTASNHHDCTFNKKNTHLVFSVCQALF